MVFNHISYSERLVKMKISKNKKIFVLIVCIVMSVFTGCKANENDNNQKQENNKATESIYFI